jgi:predicted DNA-binding transcriptional regulator YafY
MKNSRPPLIRIQHIDEQLRQRKYPNCSQVAKYFEVHSKSIQRDIEYMRDVLHAPIEYDEHKHGYYYTKNWFFLPSAFLAEQEAEALMVTRKVLSQYQGTPYYEEVSRALDKVLQYLPNTFSADQLRDVYSFEQPSSSANDTELFRQIDQAIKDRLSVKITYHAPSSGEVSMRTVRPYRLHYSNVASTWYLIGYCELRRDMRTFVVGRISELEVGKTHFEIPENFSIDQYLSKAFDLTYGKTEHEVEIRFSPYQAQWIREHRWHASQEIEEQEDGGLILKMRVAALDAVRRWVMRYGADAEVLKPGALRKMMADEVYRLIDMYC